jgi:hypothetical protein
MLDKIASLNHKVGDDSMDWGSLAVYIHGLKKRDSSGKDRP